jgi:hypothetical protein
MSTYSIQQLVSIGSRGSCQLLPLLLLPSLLLLLLPQVPPVTLEWGNLSCHT